MIIAEKSISRVKNKERLMQNYSDLSEDSYGSQMFSMFSMFQGF
jgi:hypothetical protein